MACRTAISLYLRDKKYDNAFIKGVLARFEEGRRKELGLSLETIFGDKKLAEDFKEAWKKNPKYAKACQKENANKSRGKIVHRYGGLS